MSVLDSFSPYDSEQLIPCVICGMTQWMPAVGLLSIPCSTPHICRMCMSGPGGEHHDQPYSVGMPVLSGDVDKVLCIV